MLFQLMNTLIPMPALALFLLKIRQLSISPEPFHLVAQPIYWSSGYEEVWGFLLLRLTIRMQTNRQLAV